MSYEPSFRAETVSEDIDIKMLSPRACDLCGVFMENGMDDICAECVSDDDDFDDDSEWECAYPGACVTPGMLHHRSECHTVEDAEAYYAEVEGVNS